MWPCCRHELQLYQVLSEHSPVTAFAFVCVWPTIYLDMARTLFLILFSQLWKKQWGVIGRTVQIYEFSIDNFTSILIKRESTVQHLTVSPDVQVTLDFMYTWLPIWGKILSVWKAENWKMQWSWGPLYKGYVSNKILPTIQSSQVSSFFTSHMSVVSCTFHGLTHARQVALLFQL